MRRASTRGGVPSLSSSRARVRSASNRSRSSAFVSSGFIPGPPSRPSGSTAAADAAAAWVASQRVDTSAGFLECGAPAANIGRVRGGDPVRCGIRDDAHHAPPTGRDEHRLRADRRRRVGCDLNQIDAVGASHVDRFAQRQNAELFTLRSNHSYFTSTNLPINPDERTGGGRGTRKERATQDTLNG